MISKESILDFNTFLSIYKHEHFDFELVNNTLFENIDGQLIKVKEKVINSQRAYKYFKEHLNDIKIKCNEQFTHYTKNDLITVFTKTSSYDCDILLDCTYNQTGLDNNYTYELTCSLVYKKIKNTPFDAITIMDGKFSSLYPREKNKFTYTLTDVEFTPIVSSTQFSDILGYKVTNEKIHEIKYNMETKLKKYYPNFNTSFEYIDYFLSNKTKLISSSDSRDITIKEVEKKENGEVFTPMNLVNEMLNKLPIEVWKNKNLKWLDPCCGMGNFPIAVYLKLMDELSDEIEDIKERKKHILENMLYMCELNKKNVLITKQIFDINNMYKLNLYEGDSLSLDTNKEWGVKYFDISIGNPPYNNELWCDFVEKSLKLLNNDGYLLYIHPPNWRKPEHKTGKIMLSYDILELYICFHLKC
jgi:hypothetical protein